MSRHKPVLLARVNGVSLTDRIDPKTISIEHRESGKAGKELKLTISNPKLALIDDENLAEGQPIEWRFGYPGNLSPLYSSKIYAVEPIFDAWSGLKLIIYAYDGITQLLGKYRQHVWRHPSEGQVTQSWVVEQIAAEYGMTADVEPTKNYVTEIAQDANDWDFIKDTLAKDAVAENQAHAGAYRAWIDAENGTLHFRPAPVYQKPKKTYHFFTDNIEPSLKMFRPKLNIQRPENKGASNTKAHDIAGDGSVVEEEATPQEAERTTTATWAVSPVTGEWARNEAGHVQEDPSSADPAAAGTAGDRADTSLAKAEEDGIETEIHLVGDPHIKANDIIEIRNVGKKFSGNYVCDEVLHRLDDRDGYVTEIIAFANAAPTNPGGSLTEAGDNVGGTEDNPESAAGAGVVFNEITGEASDPIPLDELIGGE